MSQARIDLNLTIYGPNANCSWAIGCTVEDTVYQYLPSLTASGVYIALFGIAFFIHLLRGLQWREWSYMGCMLAGFVDEILGYAGRIVLHKNPWSFSAFLMQIICITTGPIFFCAAIYVLLARIATTLGPQYSFFRPSFYYLIFLPCDIVSLILQALGGALSSVSSGSNKSGVDIALAGLSFQVVTLLAFGIACIAFGIRYHRDRANPARPVMPDGFMIWAAFLTLAIVCIFIRCAYRIYELKEGYTGEAITNEPLFIGLEGAMIVVAAYALIISHPGPIFQRKRLFGTRESLFKMNKSVYHGRGSVAESSDDTLEKPDQQAPKSETE